MRQTLLKLSLLAVAISPLAARAATDQLVVSSPGGPTYTFLLPTAIPTSADIFSAPPASLFFGIQLAGIQDTTKVGSVSTSTTDIIDFGDALTGGGLYDQTNGLNLVGASMFNDSSTAPAFVLSSGVATDGSTPADNINFSYSLTAYTAPAAAPEPSSLILLGTGALGVVGSFRRRLFA
jgi:hypothetical protein